MGQEKNKRGRKPIAPDTPEVLESCFEAYREQQRERSRTDLRTGDIIHMPLTWVGFMAFLGVGYKPADFKSYYGAKEEFCDLITRIDNIIEENQLEGAMLGDYSSNLVARLNGYTEKTETKHNGGLTIKHEHTGYKPASSEEEVRKREGMDGTV